MILDIRKQCSTLAECSIKVIGKEDAESIQFAFSHEAIIGFATELFWLGNKMTDKESWDCVTYPLVKDMAANQIIGFYLTPSSPSLCLKISPQYNKQCCISDDMEIKNFEFQKNIDWGILDLYETEDSVCDSVLNVYELSNRNICEIKVFNKKNENVTNCVSDVILEIGIKGIRNLAHMLWTWANCDDVELKLPHVNNTFHSNNMGIILSEGSLDAKFICKNLGKRVDYLKHSLNC